jgi:pimeloyl-ACP methyl ester carboxylesterase
VSAGWIRWTAAAAAAVVLLAWPRPAAACSSTEPFDLSRAAAIPGARLLPVERAAHYPWVKRPELFFPAAEAFLRGGWPVGAAPV